MWVSWLNERTDNVTFGSKYDQYSVMTFPVASISCFGTDKTTVHCLLGPPSKLPIAVQSKIKSITFCALISPYPTRITCWTVWHLPQYLLAVQSLFPSCCSLGIWFTRFLEQIKRCGLATEFTLILIRINTKVSCVA